jgi:biotin--protein ligase
VSLSIVEAIRNYAPGWQDVNVSLKWPNDIYGKPRGATRWEKIGGIIVNSTYLEDDYVLVVGTFPF